MQYFNDDQEDALQRCADIDREVKGLLQTKAETMVFYHFTRLQQTNAANQLLWSHIREKQHPYVENIVGCNPKVLFHDSKQHAVGTWLQLCGPTRSWRHVHSQHIYRSSTDRVRI